MPEIKEVNYFTLPTSQRNAKEYTNLFNCDKSAIAYGEASPAYSETHVFPNVAEDIYNFNPNMKIIYSVRHPYDRIKSVWKQTLFSGHWREQIYKNRFGMDIPKMPLDFTRAIKEYPPFIGASKYWSHLNKYLEFFPKDQICIFYFEDFVKETKNELRNLFSFLRIEDELNNLELDFGIKNSSTDKTMVKPMVDRITKTRIYQSCKKMVPAELRKQVASQLAMKNVPHEVELTDEQKQIVKTALNGELTQFLEYTGKPTDYWHL